MLALVLAVVSAAAALVAIGAFAVRDAPTGGVAVAPARRRSRRRRRSRGGARSHPRLAARTAAGVVGALAAAAMLSSLPVFWHGVVDLRAAGDGARLACALALVGGVAPRPSASCRSRPARGGCAR